MILLDTCALYHWTAKSLPQAARDAINATELRYVHAISGWEVACKHMAKKAILPGGPDVWMRHVVQEMHATVLSGDLDDAISAAMLPMHHRDPADRLIIAVSKRLNCPVVTSDAIWPAYGVKTIWETPLKRIQPRRGR